MINFRRVSALMAVAFLTIANANAGAWTEPVEVRQEENLCLTYQAKLEGPLLIVRAKIEPGWHTFAMDIKKRADEKLAGKASLGIERGTEFVLSGGLETAGPWYQSAPRDFSKPEIRYFSWGYEQQAIFAAHVKRTGPGPVRIAVRGQACTQTTCKNIDAAISLVPDDVKAQGETEISLNNLIQVR
jgi:DsbC/DsbD-like thiol-disulfide interchange protein